jgi:rSAM/selenodomain-associated transferase 2
MKTVARISVVIPVLNETENINRLIGHLRALPSDKDPEIIVVDGDADQSTVKAIEHSNVITAAADPGRAVQMNAGAALATGDVLLFLHADTFLPWNAFERIESALQDDRYQGGAFDLGILTTRKIFKVTECYVALRTRLTRVPFGDQGIFIRKTYFEQIGGYREIPIMEDVELMRRIRKRGEAICIITEKVMTSPRRWEKEGVLYATFRNWALQLLYVFGMPPERLARWYRS